MDSTSNFHDWLEQNDVEGHEEIYELYHAVQGRETFGNFEVSTSGEKTFIKGPASILVLATKSAEAAFSKLVYELKADDGLDMDSWYGYQRNMADPKA
jgi:hypothetical protein